MWDFNEIGIDVFDFFTGERGWMEFYAYLGELPPNARFPSAVSQDPNIARSKVDSLSEDDIRKIMDEQNVEDSERRVTPEGYTLEIEKFNQLIEEVRLLRLGMTGDKNAKFKPPLRPKTEQEVLIEKRIEELDAVDRNDFERELGF